MSVSNGYLMKSVVTVTFKAFSGNLVDSQSKHLLYFYIYLQFFR